MDQFMALFFPAFVALKIFDHLHRNKLATKDLVMYYFIFATLINLAVYVIHVYAFGSKELVFTALPAVRYLVLAVLVSIFMPFLMSIVSKGISINLEDKRKAKR